MILLRPLLGIVILQLTLVTANKYPHNSGNFVQSCPLKLQLSQSHLGIYVQIIARFGYQAGCTNVKLHTVAQIKGPSTLLPAYNISFMSDYSYTSTKNPS